MIIEISILIFCSIIFISGILFFLYSTNKQKQSQTNNIQQNEIQNEMKEIINKLFTDNKFEILNLQSKNSKELEQYFSKLQHQILEHMRIQSNETHTNQMNNLKYLQNTLTKTLQNYSSDMTKNFHSLTETADKNLKEISGQVEKRLSEGFEKTNATFTDIVKRLALIDDAQRKLNELSTNIISLQDILRDKRSRGAFGEVQLKNLIENMLPTENYSFQHTLKNGNRADCILFLPQPTGNVIIDAKFPLENYHIFTSSDTSASDKNKAQQNFKTDIKKHINAIADKYIIPGETSDGAIMFIPAEAVFAEIHRNFTQLVDFAHTRRIFLASPTTMMAIITTSSAVIKDFATRKHINVIQEHLLLLSKDFARFETRMQKLTNHIDKAQEDAHQVNTSAKKISNRFQKIEQAKLKEEKNNCKIEIKNKNKSKAESENDIENDIESENGIENDTESENDIESEIASIEDSV